MSLALRFASLLKTYLQVFAECLAAAPAHERICWRPLPTGVLSVLDCSRYIIIDLCGYFHAQEAVFEVEPARAQGVSLGRQIAGVLLACHRAGVPQHVRAHLRVLRTTRLARQIPRYAVCSGTCSQ